MKCPRCGADNAPENSYCLTCGAPFESREQENERPENKPEGAQNQIGELVEKLNGDKYRNRKTLLMYGAFAVVIILAIIIAAVVFTGGEKYEKRRTSYYVAGNVGASETYIIKNTEVLANSAPGVVSVMSESMDGEVIAVLMTSGELYINGDAGFTKAVDEVSSFVLASSGKSFVYVSEDGTLYHYNIKNSKKTTIADDINASRGIVVSPDGKYVAYNVTDKNGDDDLYVYNGKKSVEIDDALIAIAISDKGKYIYCYNTDKNGLYIYDMKGDSTKMSAGVGNSFVFNKDNTEMIFTASDGDCYVTVKGGDKQKLGSGMLTPIVPAFTQTYVSTSGIYTTATYGVEKLAEIFCYNMFAGTIVYIDGGRETERVASSVTLGSPQISKNGDTVYYMRGNTIFKVKENSVENSEEIAEDVTVYAATLDGKGVYYIDDDSVLWYRKGTGKAKKVADDIISVSVTHDGYALFVGDYSYSSNNGVLYASKNGGKKTKALDDVYASSYLSVTIRPTATYCYANYSSGTGTVDIFGAESKTKFVPLLEEIR